MYTVYILNYCKILIIRMTSFLRGHHPDFIHETLFLQFFINSSIHLKLELLVGILFSHLYALANLCKNNVFGNKKCFTVSNVT